MSTYRRCYLPGATYFFTLVTEKRRAFLTSGLTRTLLHDAFEVTARDYPFTVVAICLLPDHLHCIWTLPEGDSNYSDRWRFIKARFSYQYLAQTGRSEPTASQLKRREAGLWQRRFLEHLIRDERDFDAHVNYIHYNPVKHGLAASAGDWPWTSFHRYVKDGIYPPDWAASDTIMDNGTSFGE